MSSRRHGSPPRKVLSELCRVLPVAVIGRGLVWRQQAYGKNRGADLGDDLVIGAVGETHPTGGSADGAHHSGEIAVKLGEAGVVAVRSGAEIVPGGVGTARGDRGEKAAVAERRAEIEAELGEEMPE